MKTERFAADRSRVLFNDPAWTTMHAYFANMRGFVLSFYVVSRPKEASVLAMLSCRLA